MSLLYRAKVVANRMLPGGGGGLSSLRVQTVPEPAPPPTTARPGPENFSFGPAGPVRMYCNSLYYCLINI